VVGGQGIADRRELAAGNADIAHALPVVIDDGSALENEIERIRHGYATPKLIAVRPAPISIFCKAWQSRWNSI
jgi:hypothetical protein